MARWIQTSATDRLRRLDREVEHIARRRVAVIASIERDAEGLGLGPVTRRMDGTTTHLAAANGAPLAIVSIRPREGAAYPELDQVVDAKLEPSVAWPAALARRIA